MHVAFDTHEYTTAGALEPVHLSYEGDETGGWRVARNGAAHLDLGPGYRLMRSAVCGVCSTDLARRFLPFPLPQVTGHEVVATGDNGQRYAVDINASHLARQVETDCPFCRSGLSNHCPERLVLGIHDLPGGFAPWFLAPAGALRAIPASVPSDDAVLIEPLAAALNAVQSIDLRPGDRVAVLGPRKLGMLVIASLAAHRRRSAMDYEIAALARRADLLDLAGRLGADTLVDVSNESPKSRFEVVIDCTGSPAGFETALTAATREVHLKSTNGQTAAGVDHLTEFVVDELSLEMLSPQAATRVGPASGRPSLVVGWAARSKPPAYFPADTEFLLASDVSQLAGRIRVNPRGGLPKADVVVVDSAEQLVQAIRPTGLGEYSPVRPTGLILYGGAVPPQVNLLRQMSDKGLRLSSSRCGNFAAAIEMLATDESLQGLGAKMITHRFAAAEISDAFAAAASKNCIKAVVSHPSA
jgi:threonine dehydrogenase-like Zn-dependent dehydrogenase